MTNKYDDTLPPAIKDSEQLANELTGEDQENSIMFGDTVITIPMDTPPEIADVLQDKIEEPIDRFYDNIVTMIDLEVLDDLGIRLHEDIEDDRQGREVKDKRYTKGIMRLGWLGEYRNEGGADFEGACKATNPILAEMVVDFGSRAIKETYPPNGMVKSQLVGDVHDVDLDEATRKVNYLNYLFNIKLKLRPIFEAMFSQLPLAGSEYMKVYWDHTVDDIKVKFVPFDMLYIPVNTPNFREAERITQIIRLTLREFKLQVEAGVYSDFHDEYKNYDQDHDKTQFSYENNAEKARIEVGGGGTEQGGRNDYVKNLYECHTYLTLDEDKESGGKSAPYVVTLDKDHQTILSIYRNWDYKDEYKQRMETFVEYRYLPWADSYGLGLIEVMDGMCSIGTGAMRGLMDAALAQTFPPMAIDKNATITGQNAGVRPGQLTVIDMGTGSEGGRVSDAISPIQTAAPSPMLQFLMEYADTKKNSFQTNIDGVQDALSNGDAPVGTALALFEENNKRFGSIFARLHFSIQHLLEVVCHVLGRNLNSAKATKEMNGQLINRELFAHARNIVPVSDPNIFSEAQRYSITNLALQTAANPAYAQYFNIPVLLRRMLMQVGMTDIDEVMNLPQCAGKLNAVAENVSILTGTPIQAFPDQDHLAHISNHLDAAESPVLGMNPAFASQIPGFGKHIQEHFILFYAQCYNEAMIQQQKQTKILSHQGDAETDKVMNKMSEPVLSAMVTALQPYEKRLQALWQRIQQQQQQAQQAAAAANPETMKVQADSQIAQQKLQSDQAAQQAKMQMDQANNLAKQQLEETKVKSEIAQKHLQSQIEAQKAASAIKVETLRAHADILNSQDQVKMEHERNVTDLHQDALKFGHEHSLNARSAHQEHERAERELEHKHALEREKLKLDHEAKLKAAENKPEPSEKK